jgi:diguanylate cyclase (GGDEF)-like protein
MSRQRAIAGTVAGLLLAAFVFVMIARPGGQLITLWASDVGTTVAGMTAATALAVRARLGGRLMRPTWTLLAVGTFCAAVGDLLWSCDELLGGRETPFPSIADASYLLFPVFTGAGLLLHPHRTHVSQRLRMLTDGVLVAGSLFALSWVTAFGAALKAGADSPLGLVIALAYPVTDVMLLTITVVMIIGAGLSGQPGLITTAAALTCMTVADSAFAYLSADGGYATGSLSDIGFFAAYLLFALAAYVASPQEGCPDRGVSQTPGWAIAVPYLLCAAGVIAAATCLVGRASPVPLATAGMLVASLVARQVLTIYDNRRLLAEVAEREQRLQHQALHDDLTGLANRTLFADRLAHALTLHLHEGRAIAVIFLGLDDFKLVNDSLGHSVGDELLVLVAQRLRAAVRASDTVARLSGDEFAILVEDSDAPAETAARVAKSLEQPFVFGHHTVLVRASLGLSMVEPGHQHPEAEELLRQADLAMHSAKRHGKDRHVVFTPDLARVVAHELDIRDALVTAISEGTLDVAYQPILAAGSRRLLGFEALARWQPRGTPISPEVFLPVARRLGLIAELDELVLAKAMEQLARWRQTPGCTDLACAVNADESLFDRGRAVALYTAALHRHGLPPSALVVELPESHLSDSSELTATVAQLRAAGIRVALDDFGTHGSSLSRLHRIRVDTVKLDRDFLKPSPSAGIDETWLSAVIDLAHRLGLQVVAEGVETLQQLQTLETLGCDAVQGFLLGRPLAARDVRLSSPTPLHLAG